MARINDVRQGEGLPPLAIDHTLGEQARAWSHHMAQEGRISHSEGPPGSSPYGENVGCDHSVEEQHEAFVASPPHHGNLVAPGFTHVGVGIAHTDGVLFTTEVFMELPSQPSALVSPVPAVPPPPSPPEPPLAEPVPAPVPPSPPPELPTATPTPEPLPAPAAMSPPASAQWLGELLAQLRALDADLRPSPTRSRSLERERP